jgi:3-isopropylmalate/(R)-2-methylmalate dehydratase small subunit
VSAELEGRVFLVGDDVDTDLLAPGAYMKAPIEELARHCLEALDPDFARSVRPGDILLAGRHFGTGSSREQAAQALSLLGIRAVVARSFAGIFYRNALNLGLLAVVCPDWDGIARFDRVRLDPRAGRLLHLASGRSFACRPIPPHLLDMVESGGIVPWLERRLAARRAEGVR